ncbi:MAG: hypothetical protein R3C53_22300 [Pirellulaceae bacterium]
MNTNASPIGGKSPQTPWLSVPPTRYALTRWLGILICGLIAAAPAAAAD